MNVEKLDLKKENESTILLENLLKDIDNDDYLYSPNSWRNNPEWEKLGVVKKSVFDKGPTFPFLVEPSSVKVIAKFFAADKDYPFGEHVQHLLESIASGAPIEDDERQELIRRVMVAHNYKNEKDRTRGMLLLHLAYGLGYEEN